MTGVPLVDSGRSRPHTPGVTTLRGGRLVADTDLEPAELHFERGLISETAGDTEVIDVDGLIVAPGLIDIQINGAFGHDFTHDPTTIWEVGERLPELGVTSFVPTVVTSPGEVTDLAIEVVAHRRPDHYRGAAVLGLHFEGPWISPEMNGAHNLSHIVAPDADVARRWVGSGMVRIVTLAPELPDADAVAQILHDGGVVVSLGHSTAGYDTARRALAGPVSLVTHLFNQMTPFGHRDPGAVGAALVSDRHSALVADGIHVAPATLAVAWVALGSDRTILVSDAMAALGLGPGVYAFGAGPITVGDEGPRTAEDRLAGSVLTLPQAAMNLATWTSASLVESLHCVSRNPARLLGLTDRGALDTGRRADLALLNDRFEVIMTFVGGRMRSKR